MPYSDLLCLAHVEKSHIHRASKPHLKRTASPKGQMDNLSRLGYNDAPLLCVVKPSIDSSRNDWNLASILTHLSVCSKLRESKEKSDPLDVPSNEEQQTLQCCVITPMTNNKNYWKIFKPVNCSDYQVDKKISVLSLVGWLVLLCFEMGSHSIAHTGLALLAILLCQPP